MNLKIVSWNVRGLNDKDKCIRLSHLLRIWKADIICLQETKLTDIDHKVIQSLWGSKYVDWTFLGSNGAAGGLL
jgi:exonuclease III